MGQEVEIPLHEILLATNDFAKKIASGGYGPVYQGKSENHGMIAVKRLDPTSKQGDVEFRKEIALLSEYKHENIVSLLGFCDENAEKILVYKLESNGSLDKHLDNKHLSWIQRIRICLDAARGLKYLHDDVGPQQRILHRDVKSANILLDENWNAKISDFGLSRLGPANIQTTLLISNPCGTLGYIDPEYLLTGCLTQKSDVYSFGVVLFEILCGRPAIITAYKDERQFLTVLVRKHYERRTLEKVIYFDIQNQIESTSLRIFSTIAYQCLMNGSERPTMREVVQQLQIALDNQLTPGVGQNLINVMVNGHPIPDPLVKKAEKLAGPIHPGDYWYDSKAGFWGIMGRPCHGMIPPFIEEFNFPMPEKCADGNTNVFVNGRELHQKDLDLLASRGLPTDTDRSYTIEISGRVLDEDSGEELEGLGKLAPTVERKKHGFGMKPPRTAVV